VIERANAWQDQCKALIIRYETRVDTWLNLLIPKQKWFFKNFFKKSVFLVRFGSSRLISAHFGFAQ